MAARAVAATVCAVSVAIKTEDDEEQGGKGVYSLVKGSSHGTAVSPKLEISYQLTESERILVYSL